MLKPTRKQVGFSLIEMLIAMTIGLILLGGMIAIFSGNQRSAEMNTAMANIQENARYALSSMAKDIRMSGFQGCLDLERGSLKDKSRAPGVIADEGFAASASTGSVIAANGEWIPPLPGTGAQFEPPANRTAVPGTHALLLQFGDGNTSELANGMNLGGLPNAAGPIELNETLPLSVGDLAIISDCVGSELFRVTGAASNGNGQVLQHGANLNDSGALNNAYGKLAETLDSVKVMRFMSNVYYIADTGQTNASGDSIRALYQQSLPYNSPDNPPTELVQGVENMRVAYGIRNAAEAMRYVTADDPAFDPSAVDSIQIGLLMSSWDRIAEQDDNNTYILAGQQIPPSANAADATTHASDRRFRLVFNTTVKVRNRRTE